MKAIMLKKFMQHPDFYLIEGDVCDALGVNEIINRIMPDEIYKDKTH